MGGGQDMSLGVWIGSECMSEGQNALLRGLEHMGGVKKPLCLTLQVREECGGSPSIGQGVLNKKRPKIKQRLKIKYKEKHTFGPNNASGIIWAYCCCQNIPHLHCGSCSLYL
jgi:hypothetical protein